MTIFEKAIEDIFEVPEFKEEFVDQETGAHVTTISYQVNTDQQYTEFGIDNGVSFYLTCKCKDYTPKRNKKIIFRGTTYRIDSFYADGFGLTYNIFLKSLNSK